MTPSVRRVTAERLVFTLLAGPAALMAAGYLGDLAGARIGAWSWIAAAAVAAWVLFADLDDDQASGRGELAGAAIVMVSAAVYLAWLASPSLLPVTDGPDVVHHLQLVHVIERSGSLPKDPALAPYLVEMMNYTPGSHLAVALLTRATGLDALRVVLPVALWFVAVKAAVVYVIAWRVLPAGSGRALAALAAPILSFAPAAYAIGALYQFFFFAQVVSEAFAVGALLAVLGWLRTGGRGYPLLLALCGAGVALSWPVYLAPVGAVLLFGIASARLSWRARIRAATTALAPVAAVVLIHVTRHSRGGSILATSGAVTSPSVSVFGWVFIVCAIAGLAAGVARRDARPVLVFLLAIVVTAAALALVAGWGGARSYYLPFKLVYLAVAPLAILAAAALSQASASALRAGRAGAIVVVIVALVVTLPRLTWARPRSPITTSALEAALWVRANGDPRCVDYFTRHWLTGYWLHLDVLGNPRESDRMRAETFEFRDAVGRWIAGRGLPHAIVEEPSAIPRELRSEITVVASFPPFAVIAHPSAPCPWR